jgi:ribose transport system permease protein
MVVSLIPELALLSIPAALMLGLLLGLFNGALVAFAGLPPFIVTLGTYTRCAAPPICWPTAPR